jgi:hypothetical protein
MARHSQEKALGNTELRQPAEMENEANKWRVFNVSEHAFA